MSRGSITLQSTSQEFNVQVDQISANGGYDSPKILIPIKFDLHPIGRGYNSIIYPFELVSVKGELNATEKNFKISESILLPSWKVTDTSSYHISFQFLINSEIINKIEKYRKGNVQLHLSISLQVGICEKVILHNQGEKFERLFISGFETGQGYTTFQIEQSQWVNKILPQLGHNSYKLVEIPATSQVIPDEYKISLGEFEEARKYFINGDYDKTVAHCRAALEPFSGRVNLPKLKEFVKSKSEFAWATTVMSATEEWLDKVIKATSAFTSKTHHAPSIGHFSRTEAEIVLMLTTGIVAYIGKIEYKPE